VARSDTAGRPGTATSRVTPGGLPARDGRAPRPSADPAALRIAFRLALLDAVPPALAPDAACRALSVARDRLDGHLGRAEVSTLRTAEAAVAAAALRAAYEDVLEQVIARREPAPRG